MCYCRKFEFFPFLTIWSKWNKEEKILIVMCAGSPYPTHQRIFGAYLRYIGHKTLIRILRAHDRPYIRTKKSLVCKDGQSCACKILKGTVKLKIFFAEKGAFIIDKNHDVCNMFKITVKGTVKL